MKAMYVGISGMSAQQQALNTTSNNISNSQTTGFKSQRTEFDELFYQQYKAPVGARDDYAGMNPVEIGNGVKVGATTTDHSQGNVEYTGKRTDAAIEGSGYFVLGDNEGSVTNRSYTRDGSFKLSTNNELVATDGKHVLGWNVDQFTNEINTGAIIEPVKLDIGSVYNPKATTEIGLEGNLDIEAETGDRYGLQVPSYDSLGQRHDVNFDFVKTGNDTYQYISTIDGQYFDTNGNTEGVQKAVLNPSAAMADNLSSGDYDITSDLITSGPNSGKVNINVNGPGVGFSQVVNNTKQNVTLEDPSGGSLFSVDFEPVSNSVAKTSTFSVAQSGEIEFDSTGNIDNISNGPTVPLSYNPPGKAQQVNIDVDMTQFTGLSVDSDVSVEEQDGYGAAVLNDFSIQSGGVINGYFDDGTTREISQIAVASFDNPEGLSRAGSGQFVETPNSGLAEIGVSGTGTRGDIQGETLESSNVDLASEFVELMVTQKAFTANTKVIQTSDTVLNSVINLVR